MSTPDLQHLFVNSREIGYGRMGSYLNEEFLRAGVSISNDIDTDPAGTVLICSTPAHLLKYREGQRLICLTMWESQRLPEAFRENLHIFDLVIVPSAHNLELFGAYHPNVQFVPLGFDPQLWTPTERKTPERRFDFLIGGSGPRKGLDVAFNAFQQAFPDNSWGDGPEPHLIMKSPRATPFRAPRVTQVNGRLTEADEIALYANAHCYLGPSRGEGFGLQPLQAIAQGCPTILTDAHGHASFAHLGIGISAELTPTVPGSFMYGEAGDWWEPDVEELAWYMRDVYEHYTEACEDAQRKARTAQLTFTWQHCADKILNLIGPFSAYTGSGEWCKPDSRQYKVILNRAHAASIAGHDYQWQPWTTYYVPADTKRVLFDAGYLDPSCIDEDEGFPLEQLTAQGLLTGRESYCGTCHQRLGSMPTRADDVEAALNAALR